MRTCKKINAQLLNVKDNLSDVIQQANELFIKQFGNKQYHLFNKPITIETPENKKDYGAELNDFKTSSFCHIVSDEVSKRKRKLNKQRLACVPYIYEMLQNFNNNVCSNKKCFLYKDKIETSSTLHFIACETLNYLIILEEFRTHIIFRTAYIANRQYLSKVFT